MEHACICNIAHKSIYDIDENVAIFNNRQKGRIDEDAVKEALGMLQVGGKSGLIDRKAKSFGRKAESIYCTRYLLLAKESLSNTPDDFRAQYENFWAAYARTCLELLNQAKLENKQVNNEDALGRIRSIFLNKASGKWDTRRDITNGLSQLTDDTKEPKYRVSMQLKQIYIFIIRDIIAHWEAAMSIMDGNNIPDAIAHGSTSAIRIWCNLVINYNKEIRLFKNPEEKDKFDDKEINALQFLGSETASKTEGILELLYCIRNLTDFFDPSSNEFKNALNVLNKTGTKEDPRVIMALLKLKNRITDIINNEKDPHIISKLKECLEVLQDIEIQ